MEGDELKLPRLVFFVSSAVRERLRKAENRRDFGATAREGRRSPWSVRWVLM